MAMRRNPSSVCTTVNRNSVTVVEMRAAQCPTTPWCCSLLPKKFATYITVKQCMLFRSSTCYGGCLLVFKCQHKQTPSSQHTCRHSVCRSQLSQPGVSCGQQPEATSISREHELSHTLYGPRAFAVSGPTYWNSLPSSLKSLLLKPAHFCKQLCLHGAAVVTMLQDSRGDKTVN